MSGLLRSDGWVYYLNRCDISIESIVRLTGKDRDEVERILAVERKLQENKGDRHGCQEAKEE